jgi:hypothetical protein
MAEEIDQSNIKYVYIWQTTFYPDNVPLWKGPLAAMTQNYYFLTKKEVDAYLEEKKNLKYQLVTNKILAIKMEDKYYPLSEQFVIGKAT